MNEQIILRDNHTNSHTPQETKEKILEEKGQQWHEKMSEMMKPDVYGYILDKGIRETVVALQLLGINTVQSDDGTKGSESPWIQFGATEPKIYYEGEEKLQKNLMIQLGILPEEIDQNSSNFDREKEVQIKEGARDQLATISASYTQEYTKWKEATLELTVKMGSIIDDFYKIEQLPENLGDVRVSVEFPYRTQNHPAWIQDIPFLKVATVTPTDENLALITHEQLILKNQHEMQRFTKFLKARFFS